MTQAVIAFYLFSSGALAGAIMALVCRKPAHRVFWLMALSVSLVMLAAVMGVTSTAVAVIVAGFVALGLVILATTKISKGLSAASGLDIGPYTPIALLALA
ncbi:MAG: hypothetical protein AAGF56_10190, partial [Pseudomonadota bacterium]